ncbi:hypothetical protein PFLUV_G00183770 [Perca fluviatilis]|uniref:Uncharacterized protein n=1 Tax=Perca fluviatilis TaxID=8168 RepID=A0A6A5EMR2_PERFL|nr:hypothetical protein PFLUV_G00183770 [Perca fluviatilis]
MWRERFFCVKKELSRRDDILKPVSLCASSLRWKKQLKSKLKSKDEGVDSAMSQCEDREEGVPPSKTTLCGNMTARPKLRAQRSSPDLDLDLDLDLSLI